MQSLSRQLLAARLGSRAAAGRCRCGSAAASGSDAILIAHLVSVSEEMEDVEGTLRNVRMAGDPAAAWHRLTRPTGGAGSPWSRSSHLQRAAAVIYRPDTELASHYFEAVLPRRFDEYIWVDATRAVRPIDTAALEGMPDTYPLGL